jgi:hypothetical protein
LIWIKQGEASERDDALVFSQNGENPNSPLRKHSKSCAPSEPKTKSALRD